MSQPVTSNRRIAKNTLMLYLRMLFAMLVGLYTSRVVLATLGVEDYGIYGVVGGIVAMMGFLNASMAGATSRFLTFELGRGNHERLAMIFSSALIIHVGIALVVLVVAETAGLWFLSNKLVIPESRMSAAHWVYQLSIASAMLGITQVPYNATIIAHEKMDVYAYVEILNVTLKLLIVYLLTIGHFDKLILYAWLMFGVSLFIMMLYRIYSIRHFEEARFHWIWDKTYFKPLLSFSGWSIYGDMSYSIRQQGANFLINMFFGAAINGASMLASTVQGLLMTFSSNIITAFKPPIIKNYAVGDVQQMSVLMKFAVKIAQFLLIAISIPVLLKTEYVLKLWLGTVPVGAVVMTQLCLLINIFASLNAVLIIAVVATGRIQFMSFINGTSYLLCIPAMYVLLKLGFSYVACYWVVVVVSASFCVVNLLVIKHNIDQFRLTEFTFRTILPVYLVAIATFIIMKMTIASFADNLISFFLLCFASALLLALFFGLVVLTKHEKSMLALLIRQKIIKWNMK